MKDIASEDGWEAKTWNIGKGGKELAQWEEKGSLIQIFDSVSIQN